MMLRWSSPFTFRLRLRGYASGFRDQGKRFWIWGVGFWVWVFGFRVSGFRLRDQGIVLDGAQVVVAVYLQVRVYGLGSRVQRSGETILGFGLWGLGFRFQA